MEKNSQGGGGEFIYGLPLTVYRFYKVNKVGMYPTNGVQQIHIKSGDITLMNMLGKDMLHILQLFGLVSPDLLWIW